MITDIGDYFAKGCGRCARFATDDCAARLWAEGLAALRDLCRATGMSEIAKWGHPVYMHAGRNVAIIGALRDRFTLGLMEAALLDDPDRLMVRQGPNTAVASTIMFTDAAQVTARSAAIAALLSQAMAHAAAGRRAPRVAAEVVLPDALIDALDDDPELAEAFSALTPGRQRSYVIALSSTANPATRRTRISRLRDRILAGKGATER